MRYKKCRKKKCAKPKKICGGKIGTNKKDSVRKKKEEGKKEIRVWVYPDEEKFLREIILPRLNSLGKIHSKYTERKNNV